MATGALVLMNIGYAQSLRSGMRLLILLLMIAAGCSTPRPGESAAGPKRMAPPDSPEDWRRRLVQALKDIDDPREQAFTITTTARLYPPLTRLRQGPQLKSVALQTAGTLEHPYA